MSVRAITAQSNPVRVLSFIVPQLTHEMPLKSRYENLFRDCLLDAGIPTRYESLRFYLKEYNNIGNEITYTPDFISNLTVNGKIVLFEPHPMRFMGLGQIHRDVAKFHAFMELEEGNYHLIVASDINSMLLSTRINKDVSYFSSEYWEIPVIPMNAENPETRAVIMNNLKELLRRAD